MIRPLRVVHRSAWAALALVLPALVVAGLIARRPLPEPRPTTIEGATQSSKLGKFYLRREGGTLFLAAAGRFDYPEVLAYWSIDPAAISENAKLLGPFIASSVNQYSTSYQNGYVVLYTPAKKAIVDSAPLGGPQ